MTPKVGKFYVIAHGGSLPVYGYEDPPKKSPATIGYSSFGLLGLEPKYISCADNFMCVALYGEWKSIDGNSYSCLDLTIWYTVRRWVKVLGKDFVGWIAITPSELEEVEA